MINIDKLTKIYHSNKSDVIALNEVSIKIRKGSFTLIKGASGCGKSTLLFTLGGMLKPSSGRVVVEGEDIYKLSEKSLLSYRSQMIGFVYQAYHLIPYLNVKENILLSYKLTKKTIDTIEFENLLNEFNLQKRLLHKPSELSEGEKQRVALLRAMIINPRLLIADEPTGNLDPENRAIIMKHFAMFQKQGGTVVMASHGTEADALADTTIQMKSGKILNIHTSYITIDEK